MHVEVPRAENDNNDYKQFKSQESKQARNTLHIHTLACTHTHTNTCMPAHMHARTHTHMQTHTHTHMHKHTHTHTQTNAHTLTPTGTHMHAHMHACTHTHMQSHKAIADALNVKSHQPLMNFLPILLSNKQTIHPHTDRKLFGLHHKSPMIKQPLLLALTSSS